MSKSPAKMTKVELAAHAWTLGIELDTKATKAVMLERYDAGLAELAGESNAPAASACPPHQAPNVAGPDDPYVCVKCGEPQGL